MPKLMSRLLPLLFVGAHGACATQPAEGELVADPYESTNRTFHGFNKALDRNVLRPAAQGYDTVTPMTFQHIIGNGLNHIELAGDFVNYTLQGDARAMGRTLGRFILNTVVGAGGLLDPATEFGLPHEKTDFGLTLASYGVEEGPYLELPLFGPSNPRDALAIPFAVLTNPLTWVSGNGVTAARFGIRGTELVDTRNRQGQFIDDILYNSEDSYIALRTNFVQFRRRRAAGGETDLESVPDVFGDSQ